MSGAYLVTGASKGLGRAIARAIASEGYPVIALARETIDLGVAGAELADLHPDSITVSCNLADRADISGAAAIIRSRFDHLAGIVHNAGTIDPIRGILDVDRADWARSLQVNLIGVQDLTNRLDVLIGGEKHTRITTISSGAARRAIPGWSAYCVAKAGLDMWAQCMAVEGEQENISALAIAPGIVNTAMQARIRESNEVDFPPLEDFVRYHEEGSLADADDVANIILPYCIAQMGSNGDRLDVRDL